MKAQEPLERLPLKAGTLCLKEGVILRASGARPLRDMELRLLRYLLAQGGEAVARADLLREVWGYHPRSRSRALDTTVRRLRRAIERDPHAPEHLLTVRGVGYRFALEPGEEEAPPVRWEPDRVLEPDAFFGRVTEQTNLRELLGEPGALVTVVGPPGAGKTRLARRFVRGLTLPSRFCDLSGAVGIAGVLSRAAEALGLQLGGAADPARLVAPLAAMGEGVLILDNLEDALDAASRCAQVWREGAPKLRLLGTSRERLRVAGEQVIELGPLSPGEALALFEDRSGQPAGPGSEARARLLEGLDHLPLVIELAASWGALLDAARIGEQARRSLDFFADQRRDRPWRHQSLRRALDQSWVLLDALERRVFLACAAPVGPFYPEEAVALAAPESELEGLAALRRLRERSLIALAEPGLRGRRLRLLESLRAYGLDHLGEQALALRERWAEQQLSRVEALARDPCDDARRELIERGDAALVAARQQAALRPDLAARLLLAVLPVMLDRRAAEELLSLLEGLLAAPLPPPLRLALVAERGWLRLQHEDPSGVRAELEAALLDAPERAGRLLRAAAWACTLDQDLPAAQRHLERALQAWRAVDDRATTADVVRELGTVMHRQGRFQEAVGVLQEAIALHRELGQSYALGVTLGRLGNGFLKMNRFADARLCFQEAIARCEGWGAQRITAVNRVNLGALQVRLGELPASVVTLERAARDLEQVGHELGVVYACNYLCVAWLCRQREAEALRWGERSLTLGHRLDLKWERAVAHAYLGAARANLGHVQAAEEHLQRASVFFHEAGTPSLDDLLKALRGLVELAMAREEKDERTAAALRASAARRLTLDYDTGPGGVLDHRAVALRLLRQATRS